jgi:hypothetical protein
VFFIFGSPRSGTTLLASTLELHSEIVVPRETDFIVPLLFIVDRIKDKTIGRKLIAEMIVSTAYYPHSIGYFLKPMEVAQIVEGAPYGAADLVNAIYEAVSKKADRRVAGDKSPDDLEQIGMFQKTKVLASEKVKVIHLVRDVRDVVLSIKTMPWGRPNVEFAYPRIWNAQNLVLHASCSANARQYHLVRFEDMVADPEKTLRELTGFLDIQFQEAMLDHDQRGSRYYRRCDGQHQNLKEPFLTDRTEVWKREMSPEAQRACRRQAREGLEIFGYETSTAGS